MSEDASQRLDELKLLWESDPSSKVYLQLASVYRQKGQLDQAVEVLETSLQHRPRDPRGRVALARCKMELKDHAAAADLLEEVIRQDAAHMEANKQLLECYLQIGDAEKAEERLNIYRLLNDRDPELDHLEYRLSSLGSGEDATPEAAETPAAAPEEPAPAEAAPPESSAEAVSPAPADLAMEEPTEPPSRVSAEPAEVVTPTPEPEAISEPVSEAAPLEPAAPAVSEGAEAVSEGAEAVSEGAEEEEPAPEPPADPADLEAAAPEPAAPEPDAAEPDPVEAADQPAGADDDLFELAPAPAADDDPWGGDLFDLAAPSAPAPATEPDLGGLWEQTEVVSLDDGEDDEAGVDAAPAEKSEDDDAGNVESDQGNDSATATLGLLYLKQGHLDEAEAIFKTVLAQDAESEAALAGLAQLETLRLAESPETSADEAPAEHEEPAAIDEEPSEAEAFEVEPAEYFEPAEEVEAAEDVKPAEDVDTDGLAREIPEPAEEAESQPLEPVQVEEALAEESQEEPVPAVAAEVVEPAEPEVPGDDDSVQETATEEPAVEESATEVPAAGDSAAEDLEAEEPAVEEEPPVEPAPALTAQALLGRVALEGALPGDAKGRKIAVLQQYIQQIRTAS